METQLPPKGHSPQFRPMSIVPKRLDGSRCERSVIYSCLVYFCQHLLTLFESSSLFISVGVCRFWQPADVSFVSLIIIITVVIITILQQSKSNAMELIICCPLQFSAHVYCGQKAGCIKMPLGMEVGLSPGDFVLGGDPASWQS